MHIHASGTRKKNGERSSERRAASALTLRLIELGLSVGKSAYAALEEFGLKKLTLRLFFRLATVIRRFEEVVVPRGAMFCSVPGRVLPRERSREQCVPEWVSVHFEITSS